MAAEDPPAENEPDPQEDEGAADEDQEEIEDPFKEETITYSTEDQILGVRLDGPKVGKRSVDVFLLAEFLAQLDRVVRGLSASARGIPLEGSGRIPSPPDAAP